MLDGTIEHRRFLWLVHEPINSCRSLSGHQSVLECFHNVLIQCDAMLRGLQGYT